MIQVCSVYYFISHILPVSKSDTHGRLGSGVSTRTQHFLEGDFENQLQINAKSRWKHPRLAFCGHQIYFLKQSVHIVTILIKMNPFNTVGGYFDLGIISSGGLKF